MASPDGESIANGIAQRGNIEKLLFDLFVCPLFRQVLLSIKQCL